MKEYRLPMIAIAALLIGSLVLLLIKYFAL